MLEAFPPHSPPGHSPSLKMIVAVVFAFHLILLFLGSNWDPTPPKPKVQAKVVVQTITFSPPPSEIAQRPPAAPSPPLPSSSSDEKKQEIEEKKRKGEEELEKKKQEEKAVAEKKKELDKAEAEKKKLQLEKAAAEKKRELEVAAAHEAAKEKMAKAKESLAKLNETRDKMHGAPSVKLDSTSLPKEIASLHVDALPQGTGEASRWGVKETSYSNEVAYRLKMNLKLPEYGEVKIKLTINRAGKVMKIEIVKSESKINKAYIESKIKNIQFSSFGHNFPDVEQNTFIITLQNDS